MHAVNTAPTPLESSGALDQFEAIELTPELGTEFQNVNLAEWITAPDSDAILRDLAILVANRGVVFFRDQTAMDNELQKDMTQRMGLLSGKPANHTLSKHPMHVIRGGDPEVAKLDPSVQQALHNPVGAEIRQSHANEWHTDASYEICPPDFTVLRMTEVPTTGGDTLWASGYELYDRLSKPYQKFFESLTAVHAVPAISKVAETTKLYEGPRGAPENIDMGFRVNHPVVRTHPVTGWKSLYAGGLHCRGINDVTTRESDEIQEKILRLIADNHDLQVRFRWNGAGDMAIWDNRCVFHCPTQDQYTRSGRVGWRTLSVAEKPFLDPNSLSRGEARAARAAKQVSAAA